MSIASVKHAKFVHDKGAPETIEAMEDGSIKLAKALAIAHVSKSKQADMVKEAKATKPKKSSPMARRRKTRSTGQQKAKIAELLNKPGAVKFLETMHGAHSSTGEYHSAFKEASLKKGLPDPLSKKGR